MRKLMITAATGTITHELVDDAITLGRAPENLIQVDDPSVSGRHAQLQLAGEDYVLTDLASTNGTRVNGQPITAVTLRAGDRIRFGKVEARFECEDSTAVQPPPTLPEVAATPAEVSARPADFANASPFPRRSAQRDPVRTAIYAAVGAALLAFLGSMAALLMMQPPAL